MLDGVGSTAAVLLAESALVAAACVLAHCALTALFVAVGPSGCPSPSSCRTARRSLSGW
jgi:hypothetical protein